MSKTLFVASGARYRNGIKLWFFAVR
jgi:hypothetical protein